MTRPIYESDVDRENEEIIISRLSKVYNCDWRKLPIQYRVDYALTRAEAIVALAEVKKRRVNSDTYRTIILSAKKVWAAQDQAERLRVPALFVVAFNDKMGYVKLDADVIDGYRMGGRFDRGDVEDSEIVAHIPIEKFKWLN